METPMISEDSLQPKEIIPFQMKWNGLDLVIEVTKGNIRELDGGGSMWMEADYGFVDRTVSMEEGDGLDIFLNPDSRDISYGLVFVVGMLKEDGSLEEEKCFLNFQDGTAAKKCFLSHYYDEKFGYIYVMRDEDFVALCKMRIAEANLKNSNPAAYETHEAEMTSSNKSLRPMPLYELGKSLSTETLALVVSLRKGLRDGT